MVPAMVEAMQQPLPLAGREGAVLPSWAATGDQSMRGEARQAQIANIAGTRGNYGVSVDILVKMTSEEQENQLKKQMASNGEHVYVCVTPTGMEPPVCYIQLQSLTS